MAQKKTNIQQSLKELEKIAGWFESQKDLDVEEGLKKVKEGTQIIKELKGRLKEVENEFKELKTEIEE